MFKKDFIIGNQIVRQNAKTPMEKNFCKLMNNANFGYDCRNNSDSRYFTPIIDEIEEMSFFRKHQNICDPDVINLFSSGHLKIQINKGFDNKMAKLKKHEFYDARKSNLEIERMKELDSIESMMKKRTKNHQKKFFFRG